MLRNLFGSKQDTSGNSFEYIQRYAGKKNLDVLISAYAVYRGQSKTEVLDLVLVGGGVEEERLKDLRSKLGLESCVHMPGFVQYDELPQYYGLAEAFVLPSLSEQWGLVLNEAMAAGLPVLVSNQCGSAGDLVESNQNGFLFDPHERDMIVQVLQRLPESPEELHRMGCRSKAIIDNWSLKRFAQGLSDASLVAQRGPRRRSPSWFSKAVLRTTMQFRWGDEVDPNA